MKRVLFLILITLPMYKNIWAEECKVPIGCNVISYHLNIGHGGELLSYTEILCNFNNKTTINYAVRNKVKATSFIGLNRFFIPSKINFIYWNEDKIECNY